MAHRYAVREKRREERRQLRLAAHGTPADGMAEEDVASEAQMLYRAQAVRRKYSERCDKADAAALHQLSFTRSMRPSPPPESVSPSGAAARIPARPPQLFMPAGSASDGPLFPPEDLPGQVPVALDAPDLASSREGLTATTTSGDFTSGGSAAPTSRGTHASRRTQGSSIGPLSRAFSVFELLESDDDVDEQGAEEPIRTDSFVGEHWSTHTAVDGVPDAESDSWTPRPPRPAPPLLPPTPGMYLPVPAAAGRPPRLLTSGFDAGDEVDDVPTAYLLGHESLSEFGEQQRRESAPGPSLLARSASRCSVSSASRRTPLETLQSKLEPLSDRRDQPRPTTPSERGSVGNTSPARESRRVLRRKKREP